MNSLEASEEPRASLSTVDSEDALLVSAVLRNDRKATADFVARDADKVYAFVRSRLFPRDDMVNDIVQEVFLAAWESLDQYRGTGPLAGWLLGIARHKVEAYYRAQLRAPEQIETLAPDADVLRSIPIPDNVEQDQLQKKIREVLAALPEQYRLVLIWRYWDKVSAREMAEKTGKTEKSIERLLARARDQFRAEVGFMTEDFSEEQFLEAFAEDTGFSQAEPAPPKLKARIYSALMTRQSDASRLMSFTQLKACGQELCVFDELVRIAR